MRRLIVCVLGLLPIGLFAQSFYDVGAIQKIEINFSQPNWDYRMDTAKFGADTYLMATWVKVNGTTFPSAGVKYKGNSSFDSTLVKNPLHIALDEFTSLSYQGFTDIKLGNGYADPSLIREVLAYDILKTYMHCPRANFAQVYINGNYIGLYSNVENINKEFCSNHYNSSDETFFKCSPVVPPSPITKSNLKTIVGADSTAYFPRYELKSDKGWGDLMELCDVVTSNTALIGDYMDMDRVTWMLAFNDLLVNLDSYSGAFCQNYYLYRDETDHYNPTIWDLNMAFGGFPFLGAGLSSTATLTVADMEQLPLDIHATDPYWPLITAVMGHPRYRRMYVAHLRTLAEEVFGSGAYLATANSFQSLIDSAVASDTHKFYTYPQFQNGMTASAPNGSHTVPGISSLMTARLNYLQSVAEYNEVPPSISNIQTSPAAPAVNDPVTITTQVSGADSVFLGYRLSPLQKFVRVPMYDDGTHGDGSAGDGQFGASIVLNASEAQYYIYAEHATAGIFSPARAEHEFHTVQAAVSFPSPGDLVINEFLAQNQSVQTDEAGEFEDWIELYNNTSSALSLTGLYLTDDRINRTKCDLPPGTAIPANGLLVIWADEDPTTPGNIHCNFKLSSLGEEILVGTSSAALDSIVYGPQAVDVSYGRCPDGTGPFSAQPSPTFNALNCSVGMAEQDQKTVLVTYPNPATDQVTVVCSAPRIKGDLQVWDAFGIPVFQTKWLGSMELDVEAWPSGIYFLRLGSCTQKLVVTH